MSKAACSVYSHHQRGHFVVAIAITERGVPMETFLVDVLPLGANANHLWTTVAEALGRFGSRVTQAESLAISNKWRTEYGFNSWRKFAQIARHCSITRTEDRYIFRKGEWDGRGFGPANDGKVELPLDSSFEQLGGTLLSFIGLEAE